MSRVHDALRRATQENPAPPPRDPVRPAAPVTENSPAEVASYVPVGTAVATPPVIEHIEHAFDSIREIPFKPAPEALLVDPAKPREIPSEEFRTLRTRLNHLQSVQRLHSVVVTSASPAEGKSFTALNMALAQSQLTDSRVLIADFDFRRPAIHKALDIDVSPGITDYLLGHCSISQAMRRIAGTNLYVMTAGSNVSNPLELLNHKECKSLIQQLGESFNWAILDSPPLLFAADANLLSTMCDGAILVVRIGTTTYDSVARAVQSLCENNVIGIVVNGARRGELYSKYSYYHSYYHEEEDEEDGKKSEEEEGILATKENE